MQQRNAVGEIERFFLFVRHEHRRDPDPPHQLAQFTTGAFAQRGIEIRQRLVEQQHARTRCQRAGKRHALLLAAGERGHRTCFKPLKINHREDFAHPRVTCIARQLFVRQPIADVLTYRQMREEGVMLKDHAAAAIERRALGDVVAVEEDPACVDLLESRDQSQQRGLAAAARPEQRHQLAFGNLERYIGDHGSHAESLRHAIEAHRAHCGIPFPLPRTR